MQNIELSVKIYVWTALITAIAGLVIAVFVYIKNRKLMLNRLWALFSLLTACWSFCYYKWSALPDHYQASLTWNRWGNLFAVIIPAVFLHFTLYLTDSVKAKKKILLISYPVTFAIFFSALIFPQHFIKSLVPKVNFSNYPEGGIIFLLFFTLQFFILMNYSLYLQFRAFKDATGLKREQIKYTWIGMVVGITGASTNFFPMFHIPIYPIGNIFVGLYPMVIAYAIVRYRLMEIDTVFHRTLLWILTLLVIILPVGIAVTLSFERISTLDRIFKLAFASGVLIFFVWYYGKLKPRVDHFFRRKKYDYYQILGEIGQKIGSELDINRVASRLFKEIKDVLYIRNGVILVQQPGQPDYVEIKSIGYENLVGVDKEDRLTFVYQSPLGQWVNLYQKAVERSQVEVDPKYTPIKEQALTFFDKNAIEVLIPIIMESKVNALLGIGKKESLQAYTLKDVELLESMGRQIGITIDNAIHHEDIVEKERLAEEMKLGREIQIALLPQGNPQISGLTVRGLMQPAKEIGGDYYDFITLPDKNDLSIVIGDVSGKGVAAGLLMAMAKTAIHTLSQDEISPRKILLRTNSILNQHIGGQKFMTLLYFRWRSKDQVLTYSSAGHEHILLFHNKTQELEAIQSGGFMLGMMPDIGQFLEEKQIQLDPGDKILLYTDGVTEAENQEKDRFGLDRLQAAFKKHSAKPADELMKAIKEEVYSFIGAYPQYDDITLVVLEAHSGA